MSEQKRTRFSSRKFILLLFVVGALGICALVFMISRPSEPVYNGKLLTEWLYEHDEDSNGGFTLGARDAILHLGTNSLPVLLKWMQTDESSGQHLVRKINESQSKIHLSSSYPEFFWSRAAGAFLVLGRTAEPAIPALAILVEDPQRGSYAARALAGMGPEGERALRNALTNKSESVRKIAKHTLNRYVWTNRLEGNLNGSTNAESIGEQ